MASIDPFQSSIEMLNRPTVAEIDLDALAFNFRSCRNFIGRETKYMAVVKANAYGHGAPECARRLEMEGVDWFATALAEEALELRESGIKRPILCLGGVWPGQAPLFLTHDLRPAVFTKDAAEYLARAAAEAGVTARIHIKIDTGMGRMGIAHGDAPAFADLITRLPGLYVEGLMTHFASADDLNETEFTRLQTERFYDAADAFRERGMNPEVIDLANSPAAVAYPTSRGSMVRLGGLLYGLGDDILPKGIDRPKLCPVMSVRTKIAQLRRIPADETIGYGRTYKLERDSSIGAIPIGYHDGYRRVLSNRARVIVNGRYAPVVGRISMDWTTIDLTDVPNVRLLDEVVLLGQNGDLAVTARDLAEIAGTISYEITCGISHRVPRMMRFQAQGDAIE